jgi:hypothetical protein
MALSVQQIHPVAHLPLVLGVLRHLEVATVIDSLIAPHPAHVSHVQGLRLNQALFVPQANPAML